MRAGGPRCQAARRAVIGSVRIARRDGLRATTLLARATGAQMIPPACMQGVVTPALSQPMTALGRRPLGNRCMSQAVNQ
jgi:hypothetical protein